MKMFRKIADQRIVEAMERGEFDNLAGTGSRIDLEDDALIPAEHRLANRVLKNAGYLPEEVRLRNDIAALERLVYEDEDDAARAGALKRLELLRMKLETGSRRRRALSLEEQYRGRVVDRFARTGHAKKP